MVDRVGDTTQQLAPWEQRPIRSARGQANNRDLTQYSRIMNKQQAYQDDELAIKMAQYS